MSEKPELSAGAPVTSSAAAPARQLAEQLLPVFYQEIKRSARRVRARLGAGVTLQTTALVHEGFLRLGPQRACNDPEHFLRASALAMRHALISYAEERLAGKRGGGALHLTLSHAEGVAIQTEEGLLSLNQALGRLAEHSPRLADVVECRFFGGLSEDETAQALGTSVRTVQRDWLKARAWLYRELEEN